MKLKKFAVLALMFTTASGFAMEPVQVTTAVASEVVSEGPATDDGSSSNAGTAASVYTTAGDNTDIANNTDTNIDTSDNNMKSKTVKTSKKIKTKVKTRKKSSKKNNYTKADLRLMSSIINCEAGSEPYQGKLAVGIVVMNRIKSKSFPNTLKGVIYQSGQFSPVRNGSLRRRFSEYDSGRIKSGQWRSCIKAAKKVLNGQRTIIYRGKVKNMSSYHFFSMGLSGARLRLGGHKFK